MFVKEVTVENQVGLHARPATFFIQKANEFKWAVRRFASSLTARTSRPLSKA